MLRSGLGGLTPPHRPKKKGELKGFHIDGDQVSFQNTLPNLFVSTQVTKERKIKRLSQSVFFLKFICFQTGLLTCCTSRGWTPKGQRYQWRITCRVQRGACLSRLTDMWLSTWGEEEENVEWIWLQIAIVKMCIIIFAWKTVKLHSSCFAEIVTRAHFGSKLTRVKNSAPPFCPGTSNRCVDSGNAIWTSEDIKHRFLCSEPRFYGLPNVQFEFPGVPASGCFGLSVLR